MVQAVHSLLINKETTFTNTTRRNGGKIVDSIVKIKRQQGWEH